MLYKVKDGTRVRYPPSPQVAVRGSDYQRNVLHLMAHDDDRIKYPEDDEDEDHSIFDDAEGDDDEEEDEEEW